MLEVSCWVSRLPVTKGIQLKQLLSLKIVKIKL